MIRIYTDGSYKTESEKSTESNEICAGVGIILSLVDEAYNEPIKEEYRAIRYTKGELDEKISNEESYFACFNGTSSTMIECIGFVEGVKLLCEYLEKYPYEICRMFVDDVLLSMIFERYKTCIMNNGDIYENEHYGAYMCMMDKIFQGNIELLMKIEVEHIDAHKDNEYNNDADSLATYNKSCEEKLINLIAKKSKQDKLSNHERKVLFSTLKYLKEHNFSLT